MLQRPKFDQSSQWFDRSCLRGDEDRVPHSDLHFVSNSRTVGQLFIKSAQKRSYSTLIVVPVSQGL